MRRPSLHLAEPSRNLEESVGSPSPSALDPAVDSSLPPPEDDLEAVDTTGDETRIYTPPPHIAARLFYHPTNQTRRKDSAASSRRNSISSAQSRSSHGAGTRHVGPQSKYVAQHLRRASIIEDRKARLADRAAHAEKVRLRAALAKATIKDTSQSEERALAAAQARERNLAEIAAACAEEVKRAKAIAESMKEKREQEIRKMKLQMEERLAEAEKRREELRNRNGKTRVRERGQSMVSRKPTLVEVMPEVEEVKERESTPMREDVAVTKIQGWWRAVKRKEAVAEFLALSLSIDAVRETSFDEVTQLLSQERVLVITATVLRICGLNEGETGSVAEMAAVRSFLSAFLILGHPSQVLSNKEGTGQQEQVGSTLAQPIRVDGLANPQSQELVGKARDLLVSFENILGRLTTFNNYTPPPALFEAFSEVYATFYNAFLAWKARDSSSLVDLMVMQFVELDAIWESVKDSTDGSVDQVYKESIRDNQLLLLVRIKKLAGPVKGKQMVAAAVKASRKAKAKKPIGDTKPRGAEQSTTETAMGVLGGEDHDHAPQTQTPTPPPSPVQRRDTFKVSIVLPNAKSLLPDNRVVVHELAINREFRTEPHEYHEQQVQFFAPLFEGMRSTMQADDQDTHFALLLQVADSMREKLQRLVKPGSPMHHFIAGLLDTELARRQFTNGGFSYEKFFQTMGSLLPKLCAPVRDDEVKQLIEEKLAQGHYVDRLEALNAFIDTMLSDYANYLLQLAAPRLVQEAPAYEAKSFATEVESGKYDLSAASAAWGLARAKLLTEGARRDPEGVELARSRPTANRIYNQMLLDVFTQLSPLPLERMPEMLRLDYKRAVESGRLTRRIITTGAILLQCKNLLKRDVRAPWKSEAQRIMVVLEKSEAQPEMPVQTAVDGIMAALEAGRSMPAATKIHLRALVNKFVVAGAELVLNGGSSEPREPVLRLLLNRLKGYILARIASASATEKVKATSTAGEKLAGLGLAEFVDKVRDMVDMITRVSAVDRDAHGVWWDEVAERVGGEAGNAALPSSFGQ